MRIFFDKLPHLARLHPVHTQFLLENLLTGHSSTFGLTRLLFKGCKEGPVLEKPFGLAIDLPFVCNVSKMISNHSLLLTIQLIAILL